jgi:hypothetical protein
MLNGWFWFNEAEQPMFQFYSNVDPGHTLNTWATIAGLNAKPYDYEGLPDTATWMFMLTRSYEQWREFWAVKTYPFTPTTALDTPSQQQGQYLNQSGHMWALNGASGYITRACHQGEFPVTPGNANLYGYSWVQSINIYYSFFIPGFIDGFAGDS